MLNDGNGGGGDVGGAVTILKAFNTLLQLFIIITVLTMFIYMIKQFIKFSQNEIDFLLVLNVLLRFFSFFV